METTDGQTCPPNDEKPLLSPKPVTCDDSSDDILLDTYFDHSQPLDSNALDALLNTKFNISFDEDDDEQSTDAIKWRPAESEILAQQRSPSRTRMELSSPQEKHGSLKPAQADYPYTLSQQQHSYGQAAHATTTYHGHSYSGRMSPSTPYKQHAMMHQQAFTAPIGQVPTHLGQSHYYPAPRPVAMPTMNDVYPDIPTQPHQSEYYSPSNASRQGTADLMDYNNTLLEEDEAGEITNGEIADPCYAQLLFRCLREAPEHTMSLKDVYTWVRQYSQKARDSTGTGWQNSVRHNLSMNAVSHQEPSTIIHLHRS